MQKAPDTVLILLRARPELIRQRMAETRHEWQIVQENDVEFVLQRFEEEYEASLIPRKFALDTSDALVQVTLAEFAAQIEPLLTAGDRQRVQAHPNWPAA